MAGWSTFKQAYTAYLCSSSNSRMSESFGTISLRSGINSGAFNFFIVDRAIIENQANVFEKTFNCDGVVASFEQSHQHVEGWSPRLRFMGKAGLMTALPNNVGSIEMDNSIIVRQALDEKTMSDHVALMESIRNISGYGKLISAIKEPLHIYVAYVDDKPVGTGSAIEINRRLFILDTITIPEYRNSGVLTAVGQVSMQNAKKAGIMSFHAIVTSQYSQQTAKKIGFKEEQVFDFWESRAA